MNSIIRNFKTNLINFSGCKTNRKILVFESDDWGSIRTTRSHNYYNYIKIFEDYSNPYIKFDTIESSDDLHALFDVLSKFKDVNGKHPIFTFNTVVANPDFQKIKKSSFEEYSYVPFTDTLKDYYPSEKVFELWQSGIVEGLIYPQFHGREHVNVPVWLDQLRLGNKELLRVFDYNTWSTPEGKFPPDYVKLQASLDYCGNQPFDFQREFIKEGLKLFEQIFGFRSNTMIPNNFIINKNLFPTLIQNGVSLLQGMKYQVTPYGNSKKRNYIRRRVGFLDSSGIYFNVRNCNFEPSQTKESYDDVDACLEQIQNAFFWKKPAIINSHRLNFIGTLCEENRNRNLHKLYRLLSIVTRTWPEIEFLTSNDLVHMFQKQKLEPS